MSSFLARLSIFFFRGAPTDHVLLYRDGAKVGSQLGGSFWVYPWNTLVRIPQAELTYAFTFRELSSDLQDMTVNGEVRVRLSVDAMATRRDFSVNPATGAYLTEDIRKVETDVRNALGAFVRREIAKDELKELLTKTDIVRDAVWAAVVAAKKETFDALGVEVIGIVITAIAPSNAQLRSALEAKTREEMLAAADKAVHDRRMAAADAERRLKERELETQKTLEEGRVQLVAATSANLIASAIAEATATAKRLEPYKDIPSDVLFALALQEASKNGIDTLNVSPDLLAAFRSVAKA